MSTQTAPSDLDNAEASFREHGFAVLKGLFTGAELEALQEEAAAQIDAGDADRGPKAHFSRGLSTEGNEVLYRIDSVIGKQLRNESMLLAMVHPQVLAMTERLVDHDRVCWADAMFWKGPEGGAPMGMHSGHGWNDPAVEYENLVVDIYLDEATPHNGCLKVLPGSHLLTPDENRALVEQGFDAPGQVDVLMEPGDVLFHSEWMVHGSLGTGHLGRPTRRVVYFAYRNPAVFVANGPSLDRRRHVIASCLRRMQIAQERRHLAPHAAQEEPYGFTIPAGWEDEVEAITDEEAFAYGWFADPNPEDFGISEG